MNRNLTKLTLSAERQTILKAKRVAKARNTSVSALFVNFVQELEEPVSVRDMPLGPITLKALGIARLPKGMTAEKALEDELMKKYGLK